MREVFTVHRGWPDFVITVNREYSPVQNLLGDQWATETCCPHPSGEWCHRWRKAAPTARKLSSLVLNGSTGSHTGISHLGNYWPANLLLWCQCRTAKRRKKRLNIFGDGVTSKNVGCNSFYRAQKCNSQDSNWCSYRSLTYYAKALVQDVCYF